MRTLDGSLLWVEIEEYSEDKAKITGVSWFGNKGAVFPCYDAIFADGKWQLKLINMAISLTIIIPGFFGINRGLK